MKQIKELVEAYRSVMVWTPDNELHGTADHWRDDYVIFEDALEFDDFVTCDCENFALSLNRAVYEKKLLPPDDYGLMLVNTNESDHYNHCVAWFKINDKTYIADNSSREPFYKFSNMRHIPIQHNRYSKPKEWREVK